MQIIEATKLEKTYGPKLFYKPEQCGYAYYLLNNVTNQEGGACCGH